MILSVKNISKSFGAEKVLDNVNIDLIKGEFFSVVGPSGCGKTTLLRILAGLEFPSDGQIFINDIDSTNLIPQKRNIGIVFQNYALFPNMTVLENIAYGLEIKKFSKEEIREKVNLALEKVKLTSHARKSVTLLSGGQQQRVSLARVLVTEPALLLFDEPLSNLDYSLRLEARNEIKRLQKDIGITSVYVTHDQSEALAMSDRIAVMNKGKIMQIGTPREIYFEPQNIFVADFIGHSNFFDKAEAKKIFNIDIEKDSVLSLFPEELIPKLSITESDLKLIDIQFTGFSMEYLITFGDRIINSRRPASYTENTLRPGDNISFTIDHSKLRILKDEKE